MSSEEEESLPHSIDVVSSVVPRHDIMKWPVLVPVQDFSYIALILKIKDFLPTFFRCFVANQWRVEELFSLMIVCKEWYREISTVFVDLEWLKPMRTRGQLFVDEIPLLVESIVSGEWDKHPYATKVGNVEQFYGKMRANMFDKEAMKVAVVALGDVVNSELCTKHAQRAVRMVEAVMKMHGKSVSVQICGYQAISSIAEKSFNVPLLISLMPLVLQALRDFSGDDRLANAGVIAVKSIIGSEYGHMTVAVETGAIALILQIMRLNKGSMFFQNCTELLVLVESYRGEREVELAVHDVVYEAMAMMPEDTLVQTCGMRILYAMLAWNPGLHMKVFAEDKGVQLIFSAMRKQNGGNNDDSARDAFGMCLLQSLAKPTSGTFGVMIEAGLVPLVLAVMARTHHVQHERQLQGAALKILLRVTSNESDPRALCAAEVVPLVLAAMTSFGVDEFLQRDGAQLLGHLTRTPTTRDALPKGLTECVVRAMKRFPSGLEVNKACMFALMCFVLNRRNVPAVVAVDGVQIIMRSMSTHSGHARVLECGFLVLTCLSTHEESRVYIQDDTQRHGGVLAMALEAVRAQTMNGNFEAVGHAIGALASFVEDYPHMHAAFRKNGGVREMNMACGHRRLTPKSRAVAQRILRVCGV